MITFNSRTRKADKESGGRDEGRVWRNMRGGGGEC